VILEVRLPDRPGGLGAVASRIGAVGADITDVAVAGRDTGMAIDVFHLTLPRSDVDLIALLRHELAEVDGATIQGWRTAECCAPVAALAPGPPAPA
jgi:UTP:GlnB (protein PII) uridylyltransferase